MLNLKIISLCLLCVFGAKGKKTSLITACVAVVVGGAYHSAPTRRDGAATLNRLVSWVQCNARDFLRFFVRWMCDRWNCRTRRLVSACFTSCPQVVMTKRRRLRLLCWPANEIMIVAIVIAIAVRPGSVVASACSFDIVFFSLQLSGTIDSTEIAQHSSISNCIYLFTISDTQASMASATPNRGQTE